MNPAVDEAALECARRELEHPTLDDARLFAVGPGPVLDAAGRPLVARARPIGTDAALVWFLGRHYPLDLAVEVATRSGAGWRPVFAQPDAHARVALRIVSPGLSPDAITAALGLSATREAPAGRSLDGQPVGRREHLWLRDVLADTPAPVEEKLAALLTLVEPHAAALVELGPRIAARVTVAYHADLERMQGLALEPWLLQRLSAIGLGLDLDLYAERLGTPPRGAD
jgi:hypothetical protein